MPKVSLSNVPYATWHTIVCIVIRCRSSCLPR